MALQIFSKIDLIWIFGTKCLAWAGINCNEHILTIWTTVYRKPDD